MVIKLRRLVALTRDGKRVDLKGSSKSMALAEEKLELIPQVDEIYRVACSTEDTTPIPKDFVPSMRHHRYWCPYCGAERRFLDIYPGDYLNCEVCRISDADFLVKSMNKLDPIGKADFLDRKKEKRVTRRARREKLQRIKDGEE